MNKKRLGCFVGLMILALALAACGGTTAEPAAAPEPVVEEAPEPTAVPTQEMVEEPEETTEEPEEMETAVTNAVTVSDQELSADNTVTIDSVTADVAGWLVIHAQADGAPGPVLGHAPVPAGDNSDVVVEIDPAGATETLYAMLHVDAGTMGEYEFPGDDGPAVDAAGSVVTPSFNLTGGLSAAATVMTAENDELGAYLVDADGMTLYMFTNDEADMSNCYDQCAQIWPPLLIEEGEEPVPGADVTGELDVTMRDDDTLQITYNGIPLYYLVDDVAPGDVLGQGFNDVWFVVSPSDSFSMQPAAPTAEAEEEGEPDY